MMSIDKVGGALTGANVFGETQKTAAKDFAEVFSEALNAVASTDKADQLSNLEMLAGEDATLHGTLLAAEEADIALRLTLEVRNKVVEAYKEIMQMQV